MKNFFAIICILLSTSAFSQNVGIGTTTPHAQLQLSNALANRKLVLNESVNNDHQFYGFGMNSGVFRYQVSNPTGNHVFFSGTSATSSNELMRITGAGNVGIGVNNPGNKLDILHSGLRTNEHPTGLPLYVTGLTEEDSLGVEFRHNNGTQGIGFGYNTIYATGSNFDQDLSFKARGFTGRLKFFTNQTEWMRISEIGNIGIGVTDPHAKLHFSNELSSRKIILYEDDNSIHQFYGFGVNTGLLRFQVPNLSSNYIFYAGASGSSSNELMRIQGNGNVGIGVTNALNKLDIRLGDARTGTHPSDLPLYVTGNMGPGNNGVEFRQNNGAEGIGFGSNTIYAAGNANSQSLNFKAKGPGGHIRFNPGNFDYMILDSLGRLQLSNNLQFPNYVTHPRMIVLYDEGTYEQFAGIGIRDNTVSYQLSNLNAAHLFLSAVDPNTTHELMRITGLGKVGIGNNSPNGSLHFRTITENRKIVLFEFANNDHQYYGLGVNGGIFRLQIPTSSDNYVFYAGSSSIGSAELMRIKGNGNVGIGNNNPGQKLVVSGNGEFTGTVTASCGVLSCSDMRYKTNIQPLTNSLQMVMALNGMYYHWDKENFPEKNFNDDRQIGVAAQELEKVLPELVHTDADGYKTVDYSRLTPVLIEAIKEQQEMIEGLKKENEAMQSKHHAAIASLIERIDVLSNTFSQKNGH